MDGRQKVNLALCPDCGNECSLRATVCPMCGRPFEPGDLKPLDPPPVQKQTAEERAAEWAPEWKDEAPKSNTGPAWGFIAAVLIIILIIFCCSGGRSNRSKADCERERLRENQRRYAEAQQNQKYNPEYVGPCE